MCNSVLLPYLVGTAIYNRGRVIGWLIGGREKEARPFYPPLNAGDLETFEIMGGFIKATISNYNLYDELEQANLKLESYSTILYQLFQVQKMDSYKGDCLANLLICRQHKEKQYLQWQSDPV